jgi:hypothetical protein
MRRTIKSRRSELLALGNLQNPEAHKNGISKEEFDAINRSLNDRRDPKQQLETLKAIAAALEASPPRPAESVEPVASVPEDGAKNESTSSAPSAVETPAAQVAPAPRPRRRRPLRMTRSRTVLRHGISGEVPALDRHARKCAVCKHKDREDIEADFLHWHSASDISYAYGLPNARALFRHAHAVGLHEERMRTVRFAAAHIVDYADNVKPSANAILKAMRACTLINDRGVWIDPPTRVINYIGIGDPSMFFPAAQLGPEANRPVLPAAPASANSSDDPDANDKISNRHGAIRNVSNSQKANGDDVSNRH